MTEFQTLVSQERASTNGSDKPFVVPIEVDLLAGITSRFHAALEQAIAEIPPSQQSTPVIVYGPLMVRLYKPTPRDVEARQKHDQMYFIARGDGYFFNGAHLCGDDPIRHFTAGDVLFAPAGVVHRFWNTSDDCLVWSVFLPPLDGSSAHTAGQA